MASPDWRFGKSLFMLALGFTLLLAGCASKQERSLSALHYFKRGVNAQRAEDYRSAIAHYRQALRMDESSADIQYNLGLAFYRVGNYLEAAKAFQQAISLRPNFADAHFNAALAFDKLYQSDAAHEHYNIFRSLSLGTATAAAVVKPMALTAAGRKSPGTSSPRPPPYVPKPKRGKTAANSKTQAPPRTSGRMTRALSSPPAKANEQPRHNASVIPYGQQAPLPQQSNNEGSKKWWIQEKFTPKP